MKACKLTALRVQRLKVPGLYGDGAGLWLQVAHASVGSADERRVTKSWAFRYMLRGRARVMGLGSLADVSLAEARDRAGEARRLLAAHVDPIEAKEAERRKAAEEAARAISFKQCATAYIAAHAAGWRSPKHKQQWENTLQQYAEPVIGALAVAAIDTGLVLRVLEPIWTSKPQTANRLRQRIERVLDWATVRGYRQGENPARWRGHVEALLPPLGKIAVVEHHAALPHSEIGDFVTALRAQEGVPARAMEFMILTATRTSETLRAAWGEIDLAEKLWTIPAERTKSRREHKVPLSGQALEILAEMQEHRAVADGEEADAQLVFPSAKRGRPMSGMAFLRVLDKMGRRDIATGHGFRSTFRVWAAECTSFAAEIAEMALAHSGGDKVVVAYQRSDLLGKRRLLMERWAEHCATPSAKRGATVTVLRQA